VNHVTKPQVNNPVGKPRKSQSSSVCMGIHTHKSVTYIQKTEAISKSDTLRLPCLHTSSHEVAHEFAFCRIGLKWCQVEHFDTKGTNRVGHQSKTGMITEWQRTMQRGCRTCTERHSKQRVPTRGKRRRANSDPAVTTSVDDTHTPLPTPV